MLTEDYTPNVIFIFPATTFQLTPFIQECTVLDENVWLSKAHILTLLIRISLEVEADEIFFLSDIRDNVVSLQSIQGETEFWFKQRVR